MAEDEEQQDENIEYAKKWELPNLMQVCEVQSYDAERNVVTVRAKKLSEEIGDDGSHEHNVDYIKGVCHVLSWDSGLIRYCHAYEAGEKVLCLFPDINNLEGDVDEVEGYCVGSFRSNPPLKSPSTHGVCFGNSYMRFSDDGEFFINCEKDAVIKARNIQLN